MVSVIIPVYNAAAFIGDTIRSVLAQTERDFELILVDDCSTDDSVRRMEETTAGTLPPERLRIIRKERNGGVAAARNTGMDAAQGRYVAFLDADDLWMPEKLERTRAFLEERKSGFVFTAYAFADADAKPTGKVVHVPERLTFREALSRTVIFTSTVMMDTEVIPSALMRMPRMASEDTATWWRILKAGYTADGLDETLTVYRRAGGSLSANKWNAVKRIWGLYRAKEVAGLSVPDAAVQFAGWAVRATRRRL